MVQDPKNTVTGSGRRPLTASPNRINGHIGSLGQIRASAGLALEGGQEPILTNLYFHPGELTLDKEMTVDG